MFKEFAFIVCTAIVGNSLLAQNAVAEPIIGGLSHFTLQSGFVTDAVPYDPVARAIALGLSPERMDAAFDRALAQAEQCPSDAVLASAPISCLGVAVGQPMS